MDTFIGRSFKFRGWMKKAKRMIAPENLAVGVKNMKPGGDWVYMQSTGRCDKNGQLIFEGDILRVKHEIGDDNLKSDALYMAVIDPMTGINLRYLCLANDDQHNQYPVYTTLSSENGSLGVDYVNRHYDRLMVKETWGENHMFGRRWKTNHESTDIEIVGNVFENPELYEGKENATT